MPPVLSKTLKATKLSTEQERAQAMDVGFEIGMLPSFCKRVRVETEVG